MPGFIRHGVFVGAEPCVSSPLRLTRNKGGEWSALPGVYPAVFSYVPYFAKTGILDTSQETSPDAIQTHGFSILLSVLSDLPPPLLRRLSLKLPATISGQSFSPPTDGSNDSTVKRSNGQTVKLLLKLRFPEAFSLCFS